MSPENGVSNIIKVQTIVRSNCFIQTCENCLQIQVKTFQQG